MNEKKSKSHVNCTGSNRKCGKYKQKHKEIAKKNCLNTIFSAGSDIIYFKFYFVTITVFFLSLHLVISFRLPRFFCCSQQVQRHRWICVSLIIFEYFNGIHLNILSERAMSCFVCRPFIHEIDAERHRFLLLTALFEVELLLIPFAGSIKLKTCATHSKQTQTIVLTTNERIQ